MTQGRKILCIDDDGLVAVASRQIALKKAGLDVLLAYNAADARKLFAANRITLVILCGSFAQDSEALAAEMERKQPHVRVLRQPRYALAAPSPTVVADLFLGDA